MTGAQSRRRGLFVVFEGGEGAGKTTQVRMLAERLGALGRDVLVTREPGGTSTAEEIRTVLLTSVDDPMSPRCEALLFAAARADHVAKVIEPALDDGALVISDRFVDSSLAYQGFARELPVDEVAQINRWATQGLVPDLTIVLDVDPRQGLARAQDGNRMEEQPAAFHTSVRRGLLTLAAASPQRYLVLDATATPETICDSVIARLGQMASALGGG